MRTEQIDVLELVINCLMEHEKRLSNITQSLENVLYLVDVNRVGVKRGE